MAAAGSHRNPAMKTDVIHAGVFHEGNPAYSRVKSPVISVNTPSSILQYTPDWLDTSQ